MKLSLLCSVVLLVAVVPLAAQEIVGPTQEANEVTHQTRGPFNYFLRSLVIPGWGQASLDRKLTGGLFLAFEGVAIGMALKAHADLDRLERTGSERLEDRRQERQDWFVLVGMNHLFSALEAFVSANLYDFPGDLAIRSLPDGQTGYGLRLALPRQ